MQLSKIKFKLSYASKTVSLVVAILSLVAVSLLVRQRQELRRQAKTQGQEPVAEFKGVEFASDEVLVKFKKEVKDKIKISDKPVQETGLSTVDTILTKHKVKSVERIAKAGKNSNKDADHGQPGTQLSAGGAAIS